MADITSFPPIPQVDVQAFAQHLATAASLPQLIDVREPQEVEIAYLEGFEVLPLSQFSQWSDTIRSRFDPDTETFVLCHHGVRSQQMCQWLRLQGFTNVKNIIGGIAAYSVYIDPAIPQY
ncbi:MAG: rhodanese-like domain-containing protein [Jaaginema sp. PMC 1079.18]|nr:rhodanese-like domain-containing protein [Jaaginema sp. PMC 1080.18]MEC4849530.1 rhodanese-like domain-containing protein [Jaaginema sp. PMC 1079.18]MEC4865722.1 rhodanese-like domain-containing protein [Jaaginema sp. PMC 1078.18]